MTTSSIRHGIVAGIDGSDSALEAARWAAAAAERFDEPVYLTHVVRGGGHDLDTLGDDEVATRDSHPKSHALLDTAEGAIREGHTKLVLERKIRPGPPAKALVDMSRSARMLVLGAAETTEMQSVFVGSNVVRIANHAKSPVVVCRGATIDTSDDRPVVVGVDGSDLSNMAVAHAFEFAAFFGAPLVAVHTWSEHSSLGGYSEARRFTDWTPHEEHENAVLAEALAGWSEKYPDVEVTRSVQRGGPMRILLEHSAEARLVAVGSHGRSPFMASVIGSTSQALIHRAWCPVLICRDS